MDRTKAGRRAGLAVLLVLALASLLCGAGCRGDREPTATPAGRRAPLAGPGADSPPPAAAALSPPRLAGARIVVGLPGTEVWPQLRAAIRTGRIGGVVLYAASFPDRAAGRRLITELQTIPRPPGLRDPLLVMVDQEGGLVHRVEGAPDLSAVEMGAQGAAVSRREGRRTAVNLRGVGANVDLAPVLDVPRPGSDIEATQRGFGNTAEAVTELGLPFAEGLQEAGVAATAKHFPGVGTVSENTDAAVATVPLSKAELRAVDEPPFAAFAAAGGALVMMSTAIYPALSEKPAAFSRAIVTGELRGRLGFKGLVLSDALGTVAARDFGGSAKAGVAAARAGVDLLLYDELPRAEDGWRALLDALRAGRLDRGEFEASAARVLDLRRALGR